ncbi:ankyrin repeat protein [Colletotrichum kahawae]|uniref:Ankyrin repeat protein n=1 Tax=Colletotrichum kahawae TaxID=34407 RepID=A0AAD9YAL6_COLKA|nr:ankyrin repeat protein [Colletotrichum kahawae]
MIIDGVSLGYEERFECPYCRTICSVRDRYEWKQHVFSDLQPYICTFQDCEQPLRLFETRGAWFKHELEAHRQRWSCMFCNLPNYSKSPDDLQKHFEESHSGNVTSHQLPWVLKACERLQEDDIISCCLCEEWIPTPTSPNNLKSFSLHLARHLQQISLASIPLHIKGLEMRDITEESKSKDNTQSFADKVATSLPRNQVQEETRGGSTQQSSRSEEIAKTTSVTTGQRAGPAEVKESAPSRSPWTSVPLPSAASRGPKGNPKRGSTTYTWVWYCVSSSSLY